MTIQRRDFLTGTLAGVGALLTGRPSDVWAEVVPARYNPYGAVMDDSPAKVLPVLKTLKAKGKGIVGMKIIGEGRFRNLPEKINHSIDFALNCGGVDTVTVGFDHLSQCQDFAQRVRHTPKRPWPQAIPDVERS